MSAQGPDGRNAQQGRHGAYSDDIRLVPGASGLRTRAFCIPCNKQLADSSKDSLNGHRA